MHICSSLFQAFPELKDEDAARVFRQQGPLGLIAQLWVIQIHGLQPPRPSYPPSFISLVFPGEAESLAPVGFSTSLQKLCPLRRLVWQLRRVYRSSFKQAW